MKINTKNIELEMFAPIDNYDSYSDLSEMTNKKPFIAQHPKFAAFIAGIMLVTPLVGFGLSNMLTQAAELEPEVNTPVVAQYVEPVSQTTESVTANDVFGDQVFTEEIEVVESIVKEIAFNTEGPGHIEPAENCTINGETRIITVEDATQPVKIKMVKEVEGASATPTADGISLPVVDGEFITLQPNVDYKEVKVVYVDVVAEQEAARAAEEQAAREAEEARLAAEEAERQAAEQAQAEENTYWEEEQTYVEYVAEPEYYEETVTYEEPAPAPAPAPVVSSAPNSGAATHSMTAEEKAVADEIFKAYNKFRASKGLSQVKWHDDAANVAYACSTACAKIDRLEHELGIPANYRMTYSDILQYSTWKMTGEEAVYNWSQSSGHRKMMQCDEATVAGVGTYYHAATGKWYYTIVYDFQWNNQSGN